MSGSILTEGMIHLPGGAFAMGSASFYPEEAPVRRVAVESFWIDETPVTNANFARFVALTGHVTSAELSPDPRLYPGMLPELAYPGSLVFEPSAGPVDLSSVCWWDFRLGASWRTPLGTGSSIDGLEDHPVVHVTHADALAYATWAGKHLPTEAEFEFAARGGLEGVEYAWGDELAPAGAMLANYWQGQFPNGNSLADGWLRTSPVKAFPANGWGLYDLIGNVWEWTEDWFSQPKSQNKRSGSCCIPANPRGGTRGGSISKNDSIRMPRKVLKGGSHLCAEEYCQRYRPAARYAQPIDFIFVQSPSGWELTATDPGLMNLELGLEGDVETARAVMQETGAGRAWAFEDVKHLENCDLRGGPGQPISAAYAACAARQTGAHQLLEHLGQRALGNGVALRHGRDGHEPLIGHRHFGCRV